MDNARIIIDRLRESLPPVFSREVAAKNLSGLLCARTFTNLDASGLGPQVKIRFGKKIGYERESFLSWLLGYIENQ